jgi:hypothetical protein
VPQFDWEDKHAFILYKPVKKSTGVCHHKMLKLKEIITFNLKMTRTNSYIDFLFLSLKYANTRMFHSKKSLEEEKKISPNCAMERGY